MTYSACGFVFLVLLIIYAMMVHFLHLLILT